MRAYGVVGHELVDHLLRERGIEATTNVDCHQFFMFALVVCSEFRSLALEAVGPYKAMGPCRVRGRCRAARLSSAETRSLVVMDQRCRQLRSRRGRLTCYLFLVLGQRR
jgi:hypothetical protein